MLLPNTGLNGAGTWSNTTDVSLAGLSLTSTLSLSETDWNKLEAIGAIFLPAAGSREGTIGQYWSATQYNGSNGKILYFDTQDGGFVSANEADDIAQKKVGCAVRLVISIG